MTADIAWVKWLKDYKDWELDPSTKVGKGFCSAPACTDKAVLVEETPDDSSTIFGNRKRGLCLGHAQTLLVGYWFPGMKMVMGPEDEPARRQVR